MRKIKLALVFILYSIISYGQIPNGYYSTATNLTGTPLRAALHNIIDNHSVKSYGSLYGYYQSTDVKANGKVWDMYSDVPNGTPPYTFTFSQTCGNYSKEGDCFNREHSWPQSWFNSNSPMVSDLFHVYPTDGKVNGIRSNYPYGEVTTPTTTSLNGSKLGPCSFPGYTGTVFEPIDEYKGDFARTYFYMCTRYYTEDSGWLTNDMIIGASLKPWALELMKKWNQQDPVSTKEINRNNLVYGIQGNRNPFIDHPEYACIIWPGGTYCTIIPTISLITKIPAIPTNLDSVLVSATITDDGSIANAQLKWGTSAGSLNQTIQMSTISGNVYSTSSKIPPQINGTTIYYAVLATDNLANVNTSSTSNYFIGTPTSPSPVISAISKNPNSPTSSDAVTIMCTITDDGSVSQANLVWGTNGTTFPNSILLKDSAVINFISTSSIPSQAMGTIVYFKINATDNLGQLSTSSIQSYTVIQANTGTCATDLIFSEYFEGSANNKYLEIFNGTTASINLSDYKVQLFANGASIPTQDIALSGTLISNAVIVLKNSAATIYSGTALSNNATNFNGNDAVALFKVSSNSYIDILGKIGENPGTAWVSGNISMLDQTLVRKSSVLSGITSNPIAGFPTLATEWNTFPKDDITFLGAHTMNCPTGNTTIIQTSMNTSGLCQGSIINANFQVTGSINQNNTYTLELSDSSGGFNNPLVLGTLTSNLLSGIVSGIIPKNTIAGPDYKVRVNASNPPTTGTSTTSTLGIFAIPKINAGPDVHICRGQSIALTASGGLLFYWDNGAGDSATVQVNPTISTTYEVIGFDAIGCSNSDSVTVFVDTVFTPEITIVLLPNTNHGISSNHNSGNQWYVKLNQNNGPDSLLFGETNNILEVEKYPDLNFQHFFAIVTNAQGCVSDTSNILRVEWGAVFNKNFQKLTLYPNPSNGIVFLQINNPIQDLLTIKVYNSIGELMIVKKANNNTPYEEINLSKYANGIYFVEVSSDKSLSRGMVLKQ